MSMAAERIRAGSRPSLTTLVVGGAVAAGVVLQLFSASDLWRDEVLSVNIARLPLGDLGDALRHDGSPPLYYLVLHGWMEVVGEGDRAVRALSALFAIGTLPLLWVIGSQVGGRRSMVAKAAIVLAATSPHLVRYATEARMYAMVCFLAALGWIALRAALADPSWPRLAGVGAIAGALLLTHYWAFYLVVAVAVVLAFTAWRGGPDRRRPAGRALVAVALGSALFLPWLPSFLDQVSSTGTPWAAPSRPAQLAVSLLEGSDPTGEATLLGVLLALLVGLGVFGRATRDPWGVDLELRPRPDVRPELAVLLVVLGLGVVGGYLASVAFAPRYTAVVFPIVVLLAARGVAVLPGPYLRVGALAVVALVGLAASVNVSIADRTQVGELAGLVEASAAPGDLVLHCPDQLSPGVIRYLGPGFRHRTYPPADDPTVVDWSDYEQRVDDADPAAVAEAADRDAGPRTVWLVWSEDFTLFRDRCPALAEALGRLRPGPEVVASPRAEAERAWLYRFGAS